MFPRDTIGGGLASRIIFVYEKNKEKEVPFPFYTPNEISLREDILLDLENLKTLQGTATPTEEFLDAWEEWYPMHEDEVPFKNNANFAGYMARRPTHVMKLNIIMAASMNSVGKDGNLLITTDVLARSIDLIKRTEVKMPNTFEGYGSARNVEVMSRIRYTIRTNKQITQRELLAAFSSDFDSIQDLTNILDLLAAMGEIKRIQKTDGHTYITHIGGNIDES